MELRSAQRLSAACPGIAGNPNPALRRNLRRLILDLDNAPASLHAQREAFVGTYVQLPAYAKLLTNEYLDILQASSHCKIAPGRVKLYLVGGRVKRTPLRASSDIDLVFTISSLCKACGCNNKIVKAVNAPKIDAQDLGTMLDQMKKYIRSICIHTIHDLVLERSAPLCKMLGIKTHIDLVDWNANSISCSRILLYDTGREKK